MRQLRHFHTELGFAHAALAGEPGLLPAISVVKAGLPHALFDAGVARDAPRLMSLSAEIASARDLLMATADPGAHMDGAYDKLYSKLHDPRFPLRLLPPYQGASDGWYQRLHGALKESLPQWLPTGF